MMIVPAGRVEPCERNETTLSREENKSVSRSFCRIALSTEGTHCAIGKIMRSAEPFCLRLPLTCVLSLRTWGSGMARLETRVGPRGQKPSNDLAWHH